MIDVFFSIIEIVHKLMFHLSPLHGIFLNNERKYSGFILFERLLLVAKKII